MEPSPAIRSSHARSELRTRRGARFVESDEFLKLLVSPRPMDRQDAPDANVLGLCDRRTGELYFIEAERIPAPPTPPHAAS